MDAASTPSIDVPDMHPIAQIGSGEVMPNSFPAGDNIEGVTKQPSGMTMPEAHFPKSEFLHTMQQRGFFADCTDLEGLDDALQRQTIPGYIGFDATAESLHVGSLIQVMMLRWLQKTGHKPIVLMGGGTTKVGDPSFRADERPLLSPDKIKSNIAGIKKIFSRFVQFGEGETDAVMPDNAEWLDGLNYLEFLRDIGRHFSVNRMLSFESVKSRLDREQTLSFLEFNYMLLQAYDFLELSRRLGCRLQMGGSDQWGNIVNGVDLARRVDNSTVFGLTSPLLTTADGRKMGKTASGAVWLNQEYLSPFDYWQFWRNVQDADVERFLLLFTEIDIGECRRLGGLRDSEVNHAKITLANNVTSITHGPDAAAAASSEANRLFGASDQSGQNAEATSGLETVELRAEELPERGLPIVKLLVRAGLSPTGKDARRLIASGGARLNGEKLSDTSACVSIDMLSNPLELSSGRKRHVRITLSNN